MDRRQKKTRVAIFEAFTVLLSKKQYNKITIQEIIDDAAPSSVFCHILQHLQKNDRNILSLFACESSELFLQYFKNSLNALIRDQILLKAEIGDLGIPEDFLINHISGSFVEMVQWWSKNGRKETPEQLDEYFRRVVPAIDHALTI